MRIETFQRANGVNGRGSTSRSSDTPFNLAGVDTPTRAATAAPTAAAASLDYLLALQGVDDPLHGRKKKVQTARTLLDMLEEVKADLLTGQVNPQRLDQLMAMVTQARGRAEPGLDDLLKDIDLRVRVELAKLGRYPAF